MVVEIILPVVEVAAIRVQELAAAPAFTPRVEAAVPEVFTQPLAAAPLTLLLVQPLAELRMFRALALAEQHMFRRVPDKRGRLLVLPPSLVRR